MTASYCNKMCMKDHKSKKNKYIGSQKSFHITITIHYSKFIKKELNRTNNTGTKNKETKILINMKK